MAVEIGIGVILLVVALLAIINTRPATFRVERSAQINAPAAAVFPLLNDFHQWLKWSPWEKLDPAMKKTFDGPASGTGASYAWVGNSKAGAGRMTILESRPNEHIAIELAFVKPFPATHRATFQLSPTSSGTLVRWIMEGKNGFASKAFSLFVNMDALIGKDFEQGLANLQATTQLPP